MNSDNEDFDLSKEAERLVDEYERERKQTGLKDIISNLISQTIVLLLCSFCLIPVVYMIAADFGFEMGFMRVWKLIILTLVLGRSYFSYFKLR